MSKIWKSARAMLAAPAAVAAMSMGMVAAPVVAPAVTGGSVAAAQECGYYAEGGEAYFNNCTTDGLIIRVGTTDGSYDRCAMPGVSHLGSAPPIRSAYVVPHVPICG